jgi:hypothetical protein
MPDRRFEAKVQQVMPTPEIVNDVVLYNVLIDVPNKERLLMTSMTAQVFFVLGPRRMCRSCRWRRCALPRAAAATSISRACRTAARSKRAA